MITHAARFAQARPRPSILHGSGGLQGHVFGNGERVLAGAAPAVNQIRSEDWRYERRAA